MMMTTKKKKVALFVGADITAQIVLNRLIDDMTDQYEPIIFLPDYPYSTKASLPELQRFAFYDRHLLQDTVYPFLEHKRVYAPNRSPQIMASDQGIRVERVANVNDPAFVARIAKEEDFIGAVSIRCFQIFKPEIISIMNNKGFFLNLHPGILPQYRGVMSSYRALAADSPEHGWTLHKVVEKIDAGEILWIKAKQLDKTKSGYSLNLDIAGIGAQSIMQAFREIEDGNVLKGFHQKEEEASYYTYPTANELEEWKDKGIELIDPHEVTKTLVEKFSQPGTAHAKELKYELVKAIENWEHQHNLNHNFNSAVRHDSYDSDPLNGGGNSPVAAAPFGKAANGLSSAADPCGRKTAGRRTAAQRNSNPGHSSTLEARLG